MNESYDWAPEYIEIADLPYEKITFSFYSDPATRALALESGTVDILGEISAHEATRLDALEEFQLYAIPFPDNHCNTCSIRSCLQQMTY